MIWELTPVCFDKRYDNLNFVYHFQFQGALLLYRSKTPSGGGIPKTRWGMRRGRVTLVWFAGQTGPCPSCSAVRSLTSASSPSRESSVTSSSGKVREGKRIISPPQLHPHLPGPTLISLAPPPSKEEALE